MYHPRRAKALLLTFDAFGTLYAPKEPVHKQYFEMAKRYGATKMSALDVEKAFKSAFKQASHLHPNYGWQTGMDTRTWWTKVIRNTFAAQLPQGQLHSLSEALVERFSGNEGYSVFPDVIPFLRRIRSQFRWLEAQDHDNDNYNNKELCSYDELFVGVISNSDDRVRTILPSLGIPIGGKTGTRSGSNGRWLDEEERENTGLPLLDFVTLSYETGHEKPSPWIFCHALAEAASKGDGQLKDWTCIHVGDDIRKDVHGAARLGWRGILLRRDMSANNNNFANGGEKGISEIEIITSLTQLWSHL